MKTRSGIHFGLLICTTILFLTGCMSPTEEFIQGVWYYDEKHLHSFIAEQQLEIYWTFDGGQFAYDACCFNIDEHATGQYRVLDETEDTITIQTYNAKGGKFNHDGTYTIKIDRENDTIKIQGGGGPYTRISPKN